MKYTFSFVADSGEEYVYPCDAKTLVDALSQLAIFVYSKNLKPSSFSYYYYVDGKRGRNQRVFNSSLLYKFWNFYRIASIMDEHYGIDKSEIL